MQHTADWKDVKTTTGHHQVLFSRHSAGFFSSAHSSDPFYPSKLCSISIVYSPWDFPLLPSSSFPASKSRSGGAGRTRRSGKVSSSCQQQHQSASVGMPFYISSKLPKTQRKQTKGLQFLIPDVIIWCLFSVVVLLLITWVLEEP